MRAIALARRGLAGFIRLGEEVSMQKIDPVFLFHVGAGLRPLLKLGVESDWLEAYGIIAGARDAATSIADHSIYADCLRQARPRAHQLISYLDALAEKMIANNDWTTKFTHGEVSQIHSLYGHFESALGVELQNASVYQVLPKGGFDLETLIGAGEMLFPKSLANKAPEATSDLREGARALAFQLWTGSGYHFHRANESVLRRYFDHVAGAANRKPKMTMGALNNKMRELKCGDKSIISALDNLISFHRNPLIHPQHSIESEDEAISLYAAIRAAMGYMLDKLPDLAPPPIVTTFPSLTSP